MIQRLAIIYITAILFAVWGYTSCKYKIFPYKHIDPHLNRIIEHFESKDNVAHHLQEKRKKFDISGFKKLDKNFIDHGFLLISRFDNKYDQVIIELFRLSDFEMIHRWIPPIEEILNKKLKRSKIKTKEGFRVQHPYLFNNGDIIFNMGEGALVRINKDNQISWIIDEHFHHSIELMHDNNFMVPIYYYNRKRIFKKIKDDGFAIISPQGKIISKYYIEDILVNNGYRGLYYGVGKLEWDRTHTNDAQQILKDSGIAKRGDIALSIRNLSTVLLYRPSQDKIIWLKTGPWLLQHDVNILDNGHYSIFGNDVFYINNKKKSNKYKYKSIDPISNIYIYDPINNIVKTPYTKILNELKMKSNTRGRSKILANGDVFIEETNSQRIMRVSKNKVRWIYVNDLGETYGTLHWSRYILGDQLADLELLQ